MNLHKLQDWLLPANETLDSPEPSPGGQEMTAAPLFLPNALCGTTLLTTSALPSNHVQVVFTFRYPFVLLFLNSLGLKKNFI